MELEVVWAGDTWRSFGPPVVMPSAPVVVDTTPKRGRERALRLRVLDHLTRRGVRSTREIQRSTGARYAAVGMALWQLMKRDLIERVDMPGREARYRAKGMRLEGKD